MSKSFRSRVGSVMRRSSTILAMSRPNTPGHADTDAVSVKSQKQPDAPALVPPQAPLAGVPSPVAESPAREAQATESEQTRPSMVEVASAAIDKPAEVPEASTTIAPSDPTILSSSSAQDVGAFSDGQLAGTGDKKPEVPEGPQVVEVQVSPPTDGGLSPEEPDPVVKAPTPRMAAMPNLPAMERSASNTEVFPSQGLEVFDSKDDIPAEDARLTPRPTYASIDPWAAPEPVKIDEPTGEQSNGAATYHSITKMPSVSAFGMPEADPFADPHVVVATAKDEVEMPIPAILPSTLNEGEGQGPVSMPLPAPHAPQDVMGAHAVVMGYSLTGGSDPAAPDTDERRPLLSTPGSPRHTSYLQPTSSEVPALIRVGRSSASVSNPLLHNLGWIEYVLPDASTYYVHPTMRVTTDVDLRNTKMLESVTSYFDHQKSGAPVGLELWLRDVTMTRRGPVAKSFLVDHRKRAVVVDSTPKEGRAGKSKHKEEDRLDMEYRYWCYVESHPIHTSLPPNAKAEAVDALSWAYADRLLPGQQRLPPPFTQEECQQLMGLLQSLGSDAQAESSVHAMVHTRIVARILLRAAQWRQTHSRPWKPLPLDAVYTRQSQPRTPVHRRVANFFISCICLGIPYFFMERVQMLRADEESGLQAPGPKLIIWACTCLAAAIVLSTSVTFLGLPGLDSYARIAGLVGIFLSTASLTSSVVVLSRLKSDENRVSTSLSGEGFVVPPRRGFVLSLPLVFLAYSLISFVAGISLYSFRGVSTTNPAVITHPFNDFTKWTVAGAVGGLACMLLASAWISRH